jgi:hypothetical protein
MRKTTMKWNNVFLVSAFVLGSFVTVHAVNTTHQLDSLAVNYRAMPAEQKIGNAFFAATFAAPVFPTTAIPHSN